MPPSHDVDRRMHRLLRRCRPAVAGRLRGLQQARAAGQGTAAGADSAAPADNRPLRDAIQAPIDRAEGGRAAGARGGQAAAGRDRRADRRLTRRAGQRRVTRPSAGALQTRRSNTPAPSPARPGGAATRRRGTPGRRRICGSARASTCARCQARMRRATPGRRGAARSGRRSARTASPASRCSARGNASGLPSFARVGGIGDARPAMPPKSIDQAALLAPARRSTRGRARSRRSRSTLCSRAAATRPVKSR